MKSTGSDGITMKSSNYLEVLRFLIVSSGADKLNGKAFNSTQYISELRTH